MINERENVNAQEDVKVLWILYKKKYDEIIFNFDKHLNLTIPCLLASVYDPLGRLNPFVF